MSIQLLDPPVTTPTSAMPSTSPRKVLIGLIGAGIQKSLSPALHEEEARHHGMRLHGYRIVGAYDIDPANIGQTIADLTVRPLGEFKTASASLNAEIGVITTRPDNAQEATDELVAAGICAILNFTSSRLTVPAHVFVEYVDFLHHLYALSFNLSSTRAD